MEDVGTSGTGVAQSSLEAVIVVKALKEQVPQSDQGREKPVIEGFAFEGRQPEQGAVGEQLDEKAQQLSRGEGGRRGCVWGLWVFDLGVFFAIVVCIL
jgi:hypothetical protein